MHLPVPVLLSAYLQHLIMFMHNKGDGLSIDLLTSTSVSHPSLPPSLHLCSNSHSSPLTPSPPHPLQEFLLGLLNIMTRSTDQLLTMFNLLSAPVRKDTFPSLDATSF